MIPTELVQTKIFLIRGQKIMVSQDLADLYGVDTKALNRAVKRNIERFPSDFMFPLNPKEAEILRCQIGTLRLAHGEHSKYLPYAFTEQGVAMLSSVLRSKQAIRVNIEIMPPFHEEERMSALPQNPLGLIVNWGMRAFARLREILATHKDLARKVEALAPVPLWNQHNQTVDPGLWPVSWWKKFTSHDVQFQVVFDAIRKLMKEPINPKKRIGYV